MTALARSLIAELRQAGAVLTCSADRRVRFTAPVPLPPDLLSQARAHRGAIADALRIEDTAPSDTPPDPPPLPEPGTSERARWYAEQARMVRGLLDAAQQRPAFWSDGAAIPTLGCWCNRCEGNAGGLNARGPRAGGVGRVTRPRILHLAFGGSSRRLLSN